MFLIEYEKNCFIDAEKIVFIGITNSSQISFTIAGSGNKYNVSPPLSDRFLNQLQAFNSNLCSGLQTRG